MSVTAGVGW